MRTGRRQGFRIGSAQLPNAMLTRDRVAGVAILLFSLGVMWETRALPLGTFHKPGPAYLPMVLAILLAGLAILVILGGRNSPPFASLGWTEGRHALAILGGCAFAALALERLGYRLTVALLVGFLLWIIERKSLLVAALMSAALAVSTYYVFYTLLKVPLPFGPRGF